MSDDLRRRWREALEKNNADARTFESSEGPSDVSVTGNGGRTEIASASEDTLEEAMEECLLQLEQGEGRR